MVSQKITIGFVNWRVTMIFSSIFANIPPIEGVAASHIMRSWCRVLRLTEALVLCRYETSVLRRWCRRWSWKTRPPGTKTRRVTRGLGHGSLAPLVFEDVTIACVINFHCALQRSLHCHHTWRAAGKSAKYMVTTGYKTHNTNQLCFVHVDMMGYMSN